MTAASTTSKISRCSVGPATPGTTTRRTPAAAPVEISEADQTVLLPQDIEILQLFEERGPMRTGEVTEAIVANLNTSSVRERLCVLMVVDNRETQIVDKDVETDEWGLVDQVAHSARGRIPEDRKLLLQRAADERLRRALERGCSRGVVADVLDISKRSTFYKRKRAAAYEFPLDAFNRGGRPSAVEASEEPATEQGGQGTNDSQTVVEESHQGDAGEGEPRLAKQTQGSSGEDQQMGDGDGPTETWGSDPTTDDASVEAIQQKLDALMDTFGDAGVQ